MRRSLRTLAADHRGATAVEFSLVGGVMILATLTMIDFGHFLFGWNQQAQAARLGARLAATHSPVAPELATMTGLETGVEVGDPVGAYERACTAAACTGGGHASAAFNRIFYGSDAQCGGAASEAAMGMCDTMTSLQPGQVTVTYRNSGADVAGTAGALRPLITVRLSNVGSGAVFVDALWPALSALPDTEVTVLAEDMRTSS
jgi:Flp pilus assembly protein TadG